MPQVSARELAKFLSQFGWMVDHQTGSHLVLRHPDREAHLSIPLHQGKDLGRGLALNLLKQAGFSVDDFLRLR